MGIVTNYLVDMITRQVDTYGLVLWFDPEKLYEQVLEHLVLSDTTIMCYEGSFFALRHQVEPLINDMEPPRLLIYLPLRESDTQLALVELQSMGTDMKPGHHSLSCNTRLSLLARYALKSVLGEETANKLEKQVIAGQITLAELDSLAEKGEGITNGVVALIFGTGNPQEIALAFLNDERYDTNVESKSALNELESLLHDAFELEVVEDDETEAYRVRLARHVLATDLLSTFQGEPPARLASVHVAKKAIAREACCELAHMWRLRTDLKRSYAAHANRVEYELGIASLDFTPLQIEHVETFLIVEKQRQVCFADLLQGPATSELVEQAIARQSSFWSTYLPEIQATWALIAVAGQVLLEAESIEQRLRVPTLSASDIFSSYAESDHPWCLLDTHHRHMERRYHEFSSQLDDGLDRLLTRARNRYMEVGATLAERFLHLYKGEKFRLDGVIRQVEVFEKYVKPRLMEGKVAYVLVDALRYEMAYELAQTLEQDANADLEAVLGTVPTITEIGMAALLPDAKHAKIVVVSEGKLGMEIGEMVVKDRKDRINFLKTYAGVKVFEAKLDDLLPKANKKVRDGIRDANLILITSQEIDMLGEENNVALARRTMDEVLRQLQQAFRVLGQEKVKAIICTADHGYLFADELSSAMKINAPGGYTADLHRRAWVGQGGEAGDAYMRTHLSDFGLPSDLDIAVPWNFACFKVKGGADAYFHGGMSPQELILPVMTLAPRKTSTGGKSEIEWVLLPGSKKITTRLCSVQITGRATSLFELTPPKVRIELLMGGKCISEPASASYGFEEATGNVQLKMSENDPKIVEPDTVALFLNETSAKARVSLHLLDAVSGAELARIDEIEMAIAL